MRRLTPSMALALVAGVLIGPRPAAAQTLYGPSDGEAASSDARAALEAAGEPVDDTIWFAGGASTLLDGGIHLLGVGRIFPCRGAASSVEELEAASRAVLSAGADAPERARAIVMRGADRLVCADRLATAAQVFGAFAARAVLASPERVEGKLSGAARLDPLARWPLGAAEPLEREFLSVRQRVLRRPRVSVHAVVGQGVEVRVDGRAAVDGRWSLPPGLHLLQAQRGSTVESAWVEVLQPSVVGDAGGLWAAATVGLGATTSGRVSPREERGDAVRKALASLHQGEPRLAASGRLFKILPESGRVRAESTAGRWRARPVFGLNGGWWWLHGSPCAPGTSGIAGDGGTDWTTCTTASAPRLAHPLPAEHWATVELVGGIQAHVVSVRAGLTLAGAPPSSELHQASTGAPILTRIRFGIGLESPTPTVRATVAAEAHIVPLGDQLQSLNFDDVGAVVDRQPTVYAGGGLTAGLVARVARTPLWVRIQGGGGWAGAPFVVATGGLEVRGP